MTTRFGSRTRKPAVDAAKVPHPAPNPSATPPGHLSSSLATEGGVAAFPRRYTNIRWRVFLAHRGVDPSWDYHLPEKYR